MLALIHDFELSYKGRRVQFADGAAPLSTAELEGTWFVALAELVGARLEQWRHRSSCFRETPRVYWKLSRTPFCENMGKRSRLQGWLGCSFDVDETACGKIHCRISADGRARFRAIE